MKLLLLSLLFVQSYSPDGCSSKWLIFCIVLLFLKGTRHLWSVPVLAFQDITYHFRVSQSVSKLVQNVDKQSLDSFIEVFGLSKDCLMIPMYLQQNEVSCTTEGEASSYSDYHFLIQSSCVWRGRQRVPSSFKYATLLCCGSVCTLLWWETVLPHSCTLFLKRFNAEQTICSNCNPLHTH